MIRNIKKHKKLIVFLSLIVTFFLFYFSWLSPRYTVPILMYHRFGYESSTLFVTPENFDRQMTYLKNKNYNVIAFDKLVEGIKSRKKFGHKTVVITIDDGYKDNFIYAYPVLKKHGFPVTIFIITSYIGARDDFMSWEDIELMAKDNISFGGHTKNQVYLPAIKNKEILWDEIAGCKHIIEDRLGTSIDYFCYPNGAFTEEVKAMVKKAGYKGACTTNRGLVAQNTDVYELKRIKVTNSDMNSPFNFWTKLAGFYNFFRSKKTGR